MENTGTTVLPARPRAAHQASVDMWYSKVGIDFESAKYKLNVYQKTVPGIRIKTNGANENVVFLMNWNTPSAYQSSFINGVNTAFAKATAVKQVLGADWKVNIMLR